MSPARRATRRWTNRRRVVAVVALTLGTAVSSACGGGDGAAFTPVDGSDGAYCATYRAWKVYELDHGEAFDQPTPAALRRWWNAYRVSEETMLKRAPSEIHAVVEAKVDFIRTRLTPLVEKYDFNLERLRRDSAAADRSALFQGPPPAVEEAQDVQNAFEEKACGTQPSPPAADVVFEAGRLSKTFCIKLSALDDEFDQIASSRFEPNVMRAVITGNRFAAALDGLDAAAPTEITADVQADTDWFRGRWSDVVARYRYDIRRIYLDATPEDLAVFNRTHLDVLAHTSRDAAYEEQVCEG